MTLISWTSLWLFAALTFIPPVGQAAPPLSTRTRLAPGATPTSLPSPPSVHGPSPTAPNGSEAESGTAHATSASDKQLWPDGQKGIRLNFRGTPLELVLDYLSKTTGLMINLETPVKGNVDVWSDRPLSVKEALEVLDSALSKNGYATILNGRTLTIVSKSSARTKDLPVREFTLTNRIDDIPDNDEMVTETIQVRYANAVNMVKDLEPLRPDYATLTANESANSLVLTATQADVRRFAAIVRALDTSIASIVSVKVFTLRFADAKELADEIKSLFPTDNSNATGPRGFIPFRMMFRGGFNPPAANPVTSEARQAAARVTVVADERTNSLVVSGPAEALNVIADLVEEVDKTAANVTELRVFHLRNADPVETANLLSSLFPDEDQASSTANRTAYQFGRGRVGAGGPINRGVVNPSNQSLHAQQEMRVTAVPDPRTESLVVTASKELMPEIAQLIMQLDANPAKKQHTFVFRLNNADSDNVQQVLQDMFGATMQNVNSQRLQNNALYTRQTQSAQTIGQGIMQQNGAGANGYTGGALR